MVSNAAAPSQRMQYVTELQKHVAVDIYGKLGNLECKCPHHNCPLDDEVCVEMMERNYKFYLSFENNVCKDYVTEKLWKVLNYKIIPIVLGGSNYAEMMPKKSYINVRDYESAEQLANYLKYLDQNETAYAEYFEWQRYFRANVDFSTAFCHLCQSLHEDSTPKVYEDMGKWWDTDGECNTGRNFVWTET
jgi:alpha-1,3-fucosyltransferase